MTSFKTFCSEIVVDFKFQSFSFHRFCMSCIFVICLLKMISASIMVVGMPPIINIFGIFPIWGRVQKKTFLRPRQDILN